MHVVLFFCVFWYFLCVWNLNKKFQNLLVAFWNLNKNMWGGGPNESNCKSLRETFRKRQRLRTSLRSGIQVPKWRQSRIEVAKALQCSCLQWHPSAEMTPKPRRGGQSASLWLPEVASRCHKLLKMREKAAPKVTQWPKTEVELARWNFQKV